LGSFLPGIIISSTFGPCTLNSCGYRVHLLGLNRKRLDFNPNFKWQLSLPQHIVLFLYLVNSSCFLGRLPYSSQVVDQDCRYHMLKIARLFILSFFLVYRLSNFPSMTYRMLSHLALAFSHFEPPYKLERRGSSCTKERPRSVDISMKTQVRISPAVIASILYIDRLLSAILLIYSPYCLFALCLGQRAKVNFCNPRTLFLVLGTLSLMNPA
jgi:hypothetical protein